MTHQVLARKWRPRDFESLVGQEHVVRALSHALDTGRLHHAYLFTGTRGVGKTTIARILAKSLNCERGLSARPCGQCGACAEIDQGRFTDYLELDAASNRGVDEMTQLLENAVYAPAVGRYKVYVIDEVHMLSSHAFNAMLKTLEEPPPHMVFILATTDPQKVPVTVLSRCLQFNLKNMTPAAIAGHLEKVLQAEGVAFERPALEQIARAAAGSMRDALSLLDQAIAYCGGDVREGAIREMLGVVDRRYLERVLDALDAGHGPELVGVADEMMANNAPFGRTLQDLAALLHRIALFQAGAAGEGDGGAIERHAGAFAPEDLQVYYQIAVHGARDLPLAPDEHAGFTMTLLRMLAFRPDASGPGGAGAAPAAKRPEPAGSARRPQPAKPRAAPPQPATLQPATPHPATPQSATPQSATPQPATPQPTAARQRAPAHRDPEAPARADGASFDGNWHELAGALAVNGLAKQFVEQCELVSHEGLAFRVRVPIRALAEGPARAKVREALAAHFGAPVQLTVEVGAVEGRTVAAAATEQRNELQARARAAIDADPFVQGVISELDGRVVPESVRPNDG
ncbi:MAG TPA: DNA polymerase III subunit gamma/tau [Burkholderiaceae bacterium]